MDEDRPVGGSGTPMRYIQVDIWPAAIAVAIGITLTLLLHVSTTFLRHAVRARTRRVLSQAIEDFDVKER